ncbi:MAG: MotA/TolQ/ExbB proton channel family protein [Deltaproteobacteria bacterium]|nr:MotA/TolQ/ExbB proton channel family protein [Deltaproteobacteria bacterium]
MLSQVIFSILLSITIFVLAFNLEVGEMGLASNLNALMIVLGGTFAATLIAYPWKKITWTLQVLKNTFLEQNEIDWTIKTIVALARTYRHSGIRTLEKKGKELPEGLLKTAVELMAFQYSREKIELILQKKAQLTYVQYETGYKILYSMARFAPALGLTGTIVNLIRIFGHIADPKSLVGYMAIALLSTFYGVVFANLCFLPLANKLKEFMDHEEVQLELIQEGILDIYDEENPTAIQFKLETLSTAALKASLTSRRPEFIPIASDKHSSLAS